MLELNKVQPAPQVLHPNLPEDRMAGDVNHELSEIPKKEEPKNIVNVESQEKQWTSRCKHYRKLIIGCVVLFVVIVAVIVGVTVPVCLTVGCPPRPSGTASPVIGSSPNDTTAPDGTTVTLQPPSTSSPRPTYTTIDPRSSPQPESATTLKAETSQQPQTQGNITPSVTDPATTQTPGKPCSEQNSFECNSTGECIAEGLKCNGVKDCEPEGEDEDNCPASTCAPDEFACNNGRCLSDSFRCDGKEDCADKEDELNCPTTSTLGPTTPIP